MKRNSVKKIACLLIIFTLLLSSSSSSFLKDCDLFNQDLNSLDVEPSASNTIYINKPYNFELQDFYDSEDLYHKYTNANYQVGHSADSLIDYPVDPFYENYETELGDPDNIIVETGTSNYADNMQILDTDYTLWTATTGSTSTHDVYADVLIVNNGWTFGTVARISAIEGEYMWAKHTDEYIIFSVGTFGLPLGTASGIQIYAYGKRSYDGAIAGASYRIGAGGFSGIQQLPFGTDWGWRAATYSGLSLSQADVNDIQFRISVEAEDYTSVQIDMVLVRITYETVAPELSTEISMQFTDADVLDDKLSLKVSSTHKTNIPTTLDCEIYNFDTTNWETIHSGSATSFTERTFSTTSFSDYLNSTNHVRLKYSGTNTHQFQLHVDYLWAELYAKLDLEYTMTFTEIGTYLYRWEITGSLYYTDFVAFEVVYPPYNFYAISESDSTSRWILQGSEISPIEDFHDDINTDYWNLVDVSDIDFESETISSKDSYVYSNQPNNNYGTSDRCDVSSQGGWYSRSYVYFTDLDSNYLFLNQTGINKIALYQYDSYGVQNIEIYNTTSFGEYTITWNNAPAGDTILDSTSNSGNVWKYWTVPNLDDEYYMFKLNIEDGIYLARFYSREYGSNEPTFIRYDVSKNYQGDGFMYMQTDTTELISLKSQDYGSHYNLSSGDYFEVDFQTSSDSKIELILLNDTIVQKTLTLSQSGNTDFGRHTSKISVDEFFEFDQLKISSTFEDEDNVKVYDIKTYKYEIVGDYADFYVGSGRDYEVYLTPDVYNLRISERGVDKINENITIPATGVRQYVYTPTELLECRLTLFSLVEEYLQFEDYHVNVNKSLNGIYGDFWLVGASFYVDVGTNVYIEVYDRFDALIDSFERLTSNYIDLYIEVYSLKIRNEATEIVDYTLQNTDTGSSMSGTLFSDEIVEYHIKNGSYSLDYVNYEDMYPRECNFELTTHKTISINSTYHTIYIGLFTYDGLGLNRDWVRLYINDARADFGFNVIDSETMELIVLDYFNNTLANETIDASAYSEYNLYVQVYSLYLLNRFTYNDLVMNITQVDSGIYMNQLIPASSALLYRFIPDINYTISVTYVNGTVYSIRTVNLTDNSQTESFGISTQPSEYPKNVYFGVYTTTGFGIDHDLLRFYIDGTRTNFGFNRIITQNVTLLVRDYLNTTLFTQEVNTSGIYEYNILITLYSLQIKNLQLQETTVDVNTTLYEGTLLSEESISFMLAEAYYEIGYYDTNNVYKQFTIYLDSNQAYELNRSQICFLIYGDQQGNHLVFENYKTYLNGTRTYINNFYMEIGDTVGIEIKDRYDISVKNDTLTVVSGVNEKYVVLTMYSLKVMSQQLCFNHINITRDPIHYESEMYWSEWIAPSEIIDFRLFAGYYVINVTNNENGGGTVYDYTLNGDDVILISSDNTLYNVLVNLANVNTTIGNQITNVFIDLTNQNSNINNTIVNIEINLNNVNSTLNNLLINIETSIENINTSIINEITSLSTEITNINSTITNEILSISADLTNINSSIASQLLTLGVNISNIHGSIVSQIIDLGVDVSNFNTSLSNQILSIGIDISNLGTSITNQILSLVVDIENIETQIDDQTLTILTDITNVNSTLLNQMVALGIDITNINTSITNQILDLSVDISNINASISDMITNIDISITTLQSEIATFYAFTNTSFINLNNVMNTSFINIENNIFTINTSISNLVIGVANDIYLINGTITTMISSLENNLLLMNVSIDTALFNLGTTLDLIGSNITSNFIYLNNTINLTNLNVNDSRIAIINNLLIINNTISTLIANVYSAVYLINNSIYTAVIDLGTYLSVINNTISGNLSFVLKLNEFLTEILQMTMFSELLNWTDIGLDISLLISQIDVWEFINHYRNQSVQIHLRYQDVIYSLTVSAQNTLFQYLPATGVEYREWSVDLQEYIGEWKPLPEDKKVDFGFYEIDVPIVPRPLEADFYTFMAFLVIFSVGGWIVVVAWAYMKSSKDEVPEDTRLRHKRKRKAYVDRKKGFYDHT